MHSKLYQGALIATALCLSACSGDNGAGETATTNAPDASSVIRIATETSYKPFSFLDASGNTVGFEIDLANAMCAQMQAECIIEPQAWDSLITGLQAGKFDAIMAGMGATKERAQVVDFSDPYFESTLLFIGKKGDANDINSVAGQKVAAQQATISANYIADNHPEIELTTYDTQDSIYADMAAGRIQYMLAGSEIMLPWLIEGQGLEYEVKGAPIEIDDNGIAIALRKGDASLKDRFNAALAEIKQNGEYDQIASKYFATVDAASDNNVASTHADAAEASAN